jgi:hypothetical protein
VCDPTGSNFGTTACPFACAACSKFGQCPPQLLSTATKSPWVGSGDANGDDDVVCGSEAHQLCESSCAACEPLGGNFDTEACPLTCAECAVFSLCAVPITIPTPNGVCKGYDLATMTFQQIDPAFALQQAGLQCVRATESVYHNTLTHPIMNSTDPVSDPHLIQINRLSTCKQIISVSPDDVFGCNLGGMLIQKDYTDTCHSDQFNCTRAFAGMEYVLNPEVGDADVADFNDATFNPYGCSKPGSTLCDPYELTMMIFNTKCECQRMMHLIASISMGVLNAEMDWHFPELGQR